MNDRTPSPSDPADDAWLELHLQEELADMTAPDLRHRILACSKQRRAEAAQQVRLQQPANHWIAAAVLLIGIATVATVLQLANADLHPDEAVLQDPKLRQPELLVKSLAEFQKHAATATRISVTGDPTSMPNTMQHLLEANRATLPPATQRAILAELDQLRQVAPAGSVWTNGIRFELPNGRYLSCALHERSPRCLGIRGLGDFDISERLHALLQPALEAVAQKTRLAGGNVMSRQDLQRRGEVSIPSDIEHLTCRGLSDDDLQELAHFQNLKSLDLSGCSKTLKGPGLGHLAQLPKLAILNLRYTEVEDQSMFSLIMMSSLLELDVSNHQRLTGEFFNWPSIGCNLETLNIGWGKSLTDAGIAAIAKVPSIRHLDLSGRTMGILPTSAIARLAGMTGLQSLDLSNLPASIDEVLAALGALPDLRELKLSWTNVSNVGLMAMSSRHAADHHNQPLPLRSLDLTGCKQLQTGVLKSLGGFLHLERLKLDRSSLQTVDHNGATSFDNFEDLQSLLKLQQLSLSSTRLDAEACKQIARLPSLRELNLSFSGNGIDDEALTELSKARQLARLELSGCDSFGDEGLAALMQMGRSGQLQLLDLNACDGFTVTGLDAFRQACPKCELRLPDHFR
jgi:Leucine-rich repeat (LRR) protein